MGCADCQRDNLHIWKHKEDMTAEPRCSTADCPRRPEAGRSRCRTCRRHATKLVNPKASDMKVLLIDIETSPNLAHVWGLWNNNVSINQLMASTEMLCFAAKWLGDPEVHFFSTQKQGRDAMIGAAWKLLDTADVVMHYNGKKFDVPHLNREFVEHGFPPPSPFKQIDLLATVRKRFRFPSNKLQYVSTKLGLAGKVGHEGHELWVKCMAGDPEAWARMETYNRQDVVLLEDLYEILLPWISNHPSRHLFDGDGACPTCGGGPVVEHGFATTRVSKFVQFRCQSCGSFFRSTRRESGVNLQESAA